jgi:hypothetical protein
MSWSEMPARFGDQFKLVSENRGVNGLYFRAWMRNVPTESAVIFETEAEVDRYNELKGIYPESFARRLVEEKWFISGQTLVDVVDIAPSSQFGSQKGFAKIMFLDDRVLLYLTGEKAHEIDAALIREFRSRQSLNLTSRTEIIACVVDTMSQIAGTSSPRNKANTLAIYTQTEQSSQQLHYLASLKLALLTQPTHERESFTFMVNDTQSDRLLIDVMAEVMGTS